MTDDFNDKFKLKPIAKDEKLRQIRYLKPETIKKYKAMIRRDIAKGLIQPDQFNNKGKKK
jgi:hypothetical protein|tara:strand:- start:3716 stop:3895 length:180 start_codon:yes stop_codon:yes gene_type:complete